MENCTKEKHLENRGVKWENDINFVLKREMTARVDFSWIRMLSSGGIMLKRK